MIFIFFKTVPLHSRMKPGPYLHWNPNTHRHHPHSSWHHLLAHVRHHLQLYKPLKNFFRHLRESEPSNIPERAQVRRTFGQLKPAQTVAEIASWAGLALELVLQSVHRSFRQLWGFWNQANPASYQRLYREEELGQRLGQGQGPVRGQSLMAFQARLALVLCSFVVAL